MVRSPAMHSRWLIVLGVLAVAGCREPSKQEPKAEKGDDPEAEGPGKKKKKPDANDEDEQRPKSKPGAPATMMAEAEVRRTLTAFFAKFKADSDFVFFATYFTPAIQRYITLENVSVEAVEKDARAFFKTKKNVRYTPDFNGMIIEPDERGTAAELAVKMEWDAEAPAAWGPDAKGKYVARSVRAKLRLLFDESPKMFSYSEKAAPRPKLRVTGETGGPLDKPNGVYATPLAAKEGKPTATLAKNVIVEDLGETFEVESTPKGAVLARKVRHENKEIWTLDRAPTTVANPNGGTSAGEVVYLKPAGEKEEVQLTLARVPIVGRDTVQSLRPEDLKETPCSALALELAYLKTVEAPSVQSTKCFKSADVEVAILGEWFVATAQEAPVDDLFARRSKGATLKTKTGLTFVASAPRSGKLVYEKHLFKSGAPGGFGPNTTDYTHAAYIVLYPEALRTTYDEPIKKMNASLSLVPSAPAPSVSASAKP